MRFSFTKAAIALATASSVVMAQTPPGFAPAADDKLQVRFKSEDVVPGATEPQKLVGDEPDVFFQPLGDKSYLVLMLDISVVLKPGSPATTLIHWIKSGLRAESGESSLGSESVGSLVPYFPPGPPPGQIHDYIVLLFEQEANFKIPASYESYFANITASVNNRIGFNLNKFIESTGLKKEPIAANWFRVSTPAQTSSQSPTASPTSTEATGTTRSSPTTVPTSGAAKGLAVAELVGLTILAMLFTAFADY